MQDTQCCTPCLFHFPYNNEVISDPIARYKDACQFQRKQWREKSRKYVNTNLSDTASSFEIWPSLETRGAFPKSSQSPCKDSYRIYNSKKQFKNRQNNENKRIKLKRADLIRINFSSIFRVPSPTTTQITKQIIRYDSPVLLGPVVKPRRSSSMDVLSWMDDTTDPPNLELRKPKSGIRVKGSIETTLADLISLGYSRPYAIDFIKKYGIFDYQSLELGESMSPQEVQEMYTVIDDMEEQEGGMGKVDIEIEVEKGARSDQSVGNRLNKYEDGGIGRTIHPPKMITNWLKKFTQGPKLIDTYFINDMIIKRKTLQSHSFTNVYQRPVKNYKYSIQLGTYDQSNVHFTPETINKNLKTLTNLIVAYCFSFFKNPCQWCSQDIDGILEIGDQTFLSMLKESRHKNDNENEEQYLEALKRLKFPMNYLTTKSLKIRDRIFYYYVSEPIVVGLTKSKDKRVFNLTKGLTVFFKQYNCALLQTNSLKLIIWKKKYYFVFDPTSRAKDLYPDEFGAAALISFFDLKTIVSMLIDRTPVGNVPFTLCHVCITKITNADSKMDDESFNNYRLLDKEKAVLNATYSLIDSCFEWATNKQALPMCIVAITYSKILPTAAWTRDTLDKIILLGNMLYCEIAIAHNTNRVTLKNMPGVFSIGPYLFKIGILINIVEGTDLDDGIESFFEHCSMGIVKIDSFTYAVWKELDYYYMFDAYPRDSKGLRKWNGTAILSMHSTIESLQVTLKMNISQEYGYKFAIHALKDLKINLCGNEFRTGRLEGGGSPKNTKPKKKLISIDPNSRAAQYLSKDTVPSESNISISSSVHTIDDVPRLIHNHTISPSLSNRVSEESLNICDLNSSKLSTMNLEPIRPPSLHEKDTFSSISDDMYSMGSLYDLLMPPEDDFSGNLYIEMLNFERKMLTELGLWRGEDENGSAMEATPQKTRLRNISGEEVGSLESYRIQILRKRVLRPPRLPTQPAICYHSVDEKDDVDGSVLRTLSKELLKETNFLPMPDGSEIINGNDTIMNYQHKNIPLLAPFIVLMANIVSHKYSVDTWDQAILDYIMSCGNELQDVSPFRFEDFTTLQFRRIVLGSTDFKVVCQYGYTIDCKSKFLEEELHYYSQGVLLISPTYSCAIFYKNFFYYLFDPYNANLVGLCQGDNVPGTCFFARFTNPHQMVARILHNKSKRENGINYEAQRFLICFVWVEQIAKILDENATEEPSFDTIKVVKKPTVPQFIGYQFKDKPPRYVIIGNDYLEPDTAASNQIKVCHFVSLSALLLLLYHPIDTWTPYTVDEALKLGHKIYKCAETHRYYSKRVIRNLLIENNFMDIILQQLEIHGTIKQNDLSTLLNYFQRKHKYLMIEFPLKCVALYVNENDHLFDPYKFHKENARWIRFKSREQLIEYLNAHICDGNYCTFYSFNVTHIRRKKLLLSDMRSTYQLQNKQLKDKESSAKEPCNIPFWETRTWLDIDPIPWNRFEIVNHVGNKRGSPSAMWNEWDVEFPNDLWSLWSNLHQKSKYFPKQTRGKQTLCNCIVCIIMTRIYDFIDWNPILLDSILKVGNQYYTHCVRAMPSEDQNHEFNIEHLISEVSVPPYTVQVSVEPIIEGKMYSTKGKIPDLCDALRVFFKKKHRQYGIVILNNQRRTRILTFGKASEDDYFMYDCESYGPPLFLPKQGCSYILRMRMFERLVFVMTLTLSSGDFWIYDVTINSLFDATAHQLGQ